MYLFRALIATAIVVFVSGSTAGAAAPSGSPSAASTAPKTGSDTLLPYAAFTKGAEAQRGLFTIWRKDNAVALELTPDQFGTDFVETAVPVHGLGGYFVTSGQMDFQEARIMRFEREGNIVSIVWPSTRFMATPNTALADSVRDSTSNSVVTLAKVISVNPDNGNVVFDFSGFLGDTMDMTDALNQAIADPKDPGSNYHLDSQRTFFGPSKAFPKNVIVEADQTYASFQPKVIDTVPDPRSVQVKVHYNIAELPASPDYMPRLFDDRVGYWDNAHVDFSKDYRRDDRVHYILRWNVQPSDPSKSMSPAKKPIVYYLSNTIPPQYRAAVRDALLTWNKAFAKIGISDAVEVKDQPDDPNWDPDDIRYNVVRWLSESNDGGFAEAQVLFNPYTGEIFRSAVVIDNDLMRYGKLEYGDFAGPEQTSIAPHGHFTDADYEREAHAQYAFGVTALSLMNGLDADHVPSSYSYEYLKAIVLHESGHDFGLMHNFISQRAYSAHDLESKSFTAQYGVTTSVMAYAPINVWPHGTPNGHYFQTTLGPYDYYVIKWGYKPIPYAHTPDQELPTLNRWASVWSDPRYRLASDEDVSWLDGHAIDPRVEQWDLSNDNIAWCGTQMQMVSQLMGSLDRRYPEPQHSYEEERAAFARLVGHSNICARIMSHYVGAEYLSRAHRGDLNARTPLSPVALADQKRAFALLDRYVFGVDAWNFSPHLLRELTYTEMESDWGYDPPALHAYSATQTAAALQNQLLNQFYNPLMLVRLADMPTKYGAGKTMELGDLFTWMQNSVYGDLAHVKGGSIPVVHRNLQRNYERVLATLAVTPPRGTPPDAQALARHELVELRSSAQAALANRSLDLVTRAHLEALESDAGRALNAQRVVAG
ncbi:MAG: zinc-dependent metalloprotease [Candidatus Eremiobacteraeota bacterium]|nr:zinc-dependent metalloprotease [Candidatus Eremiobacteraeota bacterium]